MTRDLMIVSERALTATDLVAGVACVHQGQPWQVTDDGGAIEVSHCDQPLLRASPSVKLADTAGADGRLSAPVLRGQLWRTELSVVRSSEPLAVEVARRRLGDRREPGGTARLTVMTRLTA